MVAKDELAEAGKDHNHSHLARGSRTVQAPKQKKAKERENLEEDTQLSNKVQSSGPDAAGPLLPY